MAIGKISRGQFQVVATSFLSLFSLVGIMFYGLPFFFDFWVEDFGWSRATVTSGNAFGKIVVGFVGFFAGWFIDRYGPRRLMLTGILLGGLALIGLSTMTSLWHFYFFYLLSVLGYICGGPLPTQVLISRWFRESRGKAMGVAYLGIGIGGMLVPQAAKWLNLELGWHHALMLLGIAMIVIAFPMAWFVKETPLENVASTKQPEEPIGPILKGWPFYLLVVGSMCSIGAVSGTNQNLKLFFRFDLHFTQEQAANVMSLVLGSSILGRLVMGWLADRIQKKFVMILICTLVASSIPLLFYASTPSVLYLFAFVFGVGLGGDYMIIPLMAAELFGVRVMGRIMGIVLTMDGLGESFAPMLVAWLRDRTGSYANGFAALIVLGAIGTTCVAMLPKRKDPGLPTP